MSQVDAEAIAAWRYRGAYSFYDAAPRDFRLSVATFNERAIHVYERAGFVPVRTYDHVTAGSVYPFLEMTRSATDG